MNAQVKKVLDTLPSYMIAEWALPALINCDYTGKARKAIQIHQAKLAR